MKPSKFYLFSFLLILILLTSDVKGEANTPPSSSNNRASSSGSGSQSTASSSTQTQASTTIDTTSSTSPSVSEPSNTTNSKILQESDTAQTQTSSTTEQSTSEKNGIVNENGERYYYINGVLQKGQQNINGSWYLFNRTTGVMMYGQQKDSNGQWYLFDRSSGIMRKGQVNDAGNWYLFDRSSGVMRKGQVNDAGNWYLFNRSSGIMMYGLQTDINGKTYYFNNAGKMVYGTGTLEKTNYKFNTTSGECYYALLSAGNINQYTIGAYQACEVVALYNGLIALGKTNSKSIQQTINTLPRNINPNLGYSGNPWDASAVNFPYNGYVIWATALTSFAKSYAATAQNISGTSLVNMEKQALKGRPIVIWGTLNMAKAHIVNSNYYGGHELSNSHTYLIDGYNAQTNQFHITDSIYGKYWKDTSTVVKAYYSNNSFALLL
ncbi:C39 family peptidase [Lactococcus lactis]|uniref:C39 family peptidase n=1 Tax=Lactococcus lactis subsp. lactis TaxID=1360 RepID=A0AAJ4T304_LACLL|nr:C39 family peptidase [Lactococcus lactis]QRZ36010.1 C39 family peptidase [Lactococcus lactis subsp. lactis]